MNLLPPSLLLALSLGLLPALTAQNTEGSSESKKAIEADEQARLAGETGEKEHTASVSPAFLTNLVQGTVSLRPRRLAPGESGTLVVLLILQNPAVVMADAAVGLEYDAKQGGLELGSFAVVPAKMGTLATRFVGTPVHDNSVTIEIPVTVAKAALHGDVRVTFQAKVPLTDGVQGISFGEGLIPITGQVKIGRPLPRPNIVAGVAGAGVSAIGIDPSDEDPAVEAATPTSSVPAEPTGRAAPTAGEFHTESAADVDRIRFGVDLPTPTHLSLGGSCSGRARIELPAGQWLYRGEGSELRVDVEGLGAGVTVELEPFPAGEARDMGGKSVLVSGDTLTVPVALRADGNAETGIRQLVFALTYQTVGADGAASAPRVLSVPAVLPVGLTLTTASAWPFYLVAVVLAGLLILLIGRGLRK